MQRVTILKQFKLYVHRAKLKFSFCAATILCFNVKKRAIKACRFLIESYTLKLHTRKLLLYYLCKNCYSKLYKNYGNCAQKEYVKFLNFRFEILLRFTSKHQDFDLHKADIDSLHFEPLSFYFLSTLHSFYLFIFCNHSSKYHQRKIYSR